MGNAMEFSDVLLEPSEAAAFLKVSLSWLAKARATDDGPPFIRLVAAFGTARPRFFVG